MGQRVLDPQLGDLCFKALVGEEGTLKKPCFPKERSVGAGEVWAQRASARVWFSSSGAGSPRVCTGQGPGPTPISRGAHAQVSVTYVGLLNKIFI